MLHIGCHLSVSQGFLHMGKEAASIGADTFQFFTRNPRGGSVRALDTGIERIYERASVRTDFSSCAVHTEWLFQDGENPAVCLGSHDRGFTAFGICRQLPL